MNAWIYGWITCSLFYTSISFHCIEVPLTQSLTSLFLMSSCHPSSSSSISIFDVQVYTTNNGQKNTYLLSTQEFVNQTSTFLGSMDPRFCSHFPLHSPLPSVFLLFFWTPRGFSLPHNLSLSTEPSPSNSLENIFKRPPYSVPSTGPLSMPKPKARASTTQKLFSTFIYACIYSFIPFISLYFLSGIWLCPSLTSQHLYPLTIRHYSHHHRNQFFQLILLNFIKYLLQWILNHIKSYKISLHKFGFKFDII